ncbi:unnamed protein product [Calicophoron daubneyi]|uniref:Uncharacterized protein n=1 Tax=Calicophoron daubneyi TaxID=300641 RepID=A0AAV2TZ71_CALDB
MSRLLSVCFRVACFAFFTFVCCRLHTIRYGHAWFSSKSFSEMTIHLTFLVLVLEAAYFALATPLQILSSGNLQGHVYCSMLTLSLFVFLLFWSIFLYDKDLLINPEVRRFFPYWLNHAAHSAGVVSILADCVLWKPSVGSSRLSFAIVGTLGVAYNFYAEYLIHVHGIYPYPMFAQLSGFGRCVLYGASWALLFVCFLVCYQFTYRMGGRAKIVSCSHSGRRVKSNKASGELGSVKAE